MRSDDPPPDRPQEGKPGRGEASKSTRVPQGPPRPTVDDDVPLPARSQPPRPARRPARRRGPDRARQDAWVARLCDRDESALEEVVAAYGERITAVIAGILRDRDAVDDVVQATFAKAWFRISSFKGNSGLYTWLYRVAVNSTKDYIKGRSRRPASSLDEQQAARLPSSAPHVIEGLERREARERVREAIASLPERYRTVLALRELEGMTYEGIAEVLSLSLGTVESRLFRARRRLAGLLKASDDPTGAEGTDEEGVRP